jgi:hypothetical protein
MRRPDPFPAAVAFGALLLAGCAAAPPSPTAMSGAAGQPTQRGTSETAEPVRVTGLQIPGNVEPYLRLNGKGVQVFRCERIGSDYLWRFQRPEAQLLDDKGKAVATQGANSSFKHNDGSALAARIVAYEDEPNVKDLRPVLMSATSSGKGVFAPATFVARVENNGGLPPASCKPGELNRQLRVPFTADFVFYRARTR